VAVAGNGGPTQKRPVVQSLDRALAILDALLLAADGLSLSDLACTTGLPKSTTHRLLATLEARHFAIRDTARGTYVLGRKILPNARLALTVHDLLIDLALASGETANVGVLVGNEIVFVDRADSPNALRWQLGIGARVPSHCSGLGKAILAFTGDIEVRALLGDVLGRYTKQTITDMVELRKELAKVRRRGFALDNEEFMDGVRCVAVPILDESGTPVASVSLAGPAFRLTATVASDQVPRLIAAAGAVSRILAGGRRMLELQDGDETSLGWLAAALGRTTSA
jgi:IclR family acetate operon transcriptional repressor